MTATLTGDVLEDQQARPRAGRRWLRPLGSYGLTVFVLLNLNFFLPRTLTFLDLRLRLRPRGQGNDDVFWSGSRRVANRPGGRIASSPWQRGRPAPFVTGARGSGPSRPQGNEGSQWRLVLLPEQGEVQITASQGGTQSGRLWTRQELDDRGSRRLVRRPPFRNGPARAGHPETPKARRPQQPERVTNARAHQATRDRVRRSPRPVRSGDPRSRQPVARTLLLAVRREDLPM